MSEVVAVGDGKVSGNQASIPAAVRHALDIRDGDVLRWRVADGQLDVTVVRRRPGAFADYEPGDAEDRSDVVHDHDAFGVGPG